jgi:pantothenate kinase
MRRTLPSGLVTTSLARVESRPALADLVERAEALIPTTGRAIVGIAGLPGAGKTTLAEALTTALTDRLRAGFGGDAVAHVPMDGFHLADVQLEHLGLREVKGSPDTFDAWGYAALLARVRDTTDSTVYAPGFERDLEQPIAAAVGVPPAARLVVTEGNYLLLPDPPWARARQALAETWLVATDDDTRVRRLVARHVRFGKSPDAAAAWVARSDQANARLIRERSTAPDLVVSLR